MMKKVLALLMALVMAFAFAACAAKPAEEEPAAADAKVIRLSTTTSVNDSGLLPYLLPTFEEKTGYKVEVQSAGTGAAIQKAIDGNADVILVHAKASEEEFIAGGYGVERIPFMYNYFVIVGPKADPAGVKGSADAATAFGKIKESESKFVSRGDESGTHKAELKIWGEGNEPNAEADKWYISAGQGMGACLTMASEQQAYCLTDKATFLSMKDELDLDIVLEEGEDMKNTYSLIAVNPEKIDGVNTEGAQAFIDWMLSDEASALIAKYGEEEYGVALFTLLEK
ncbi:MAG: extracellular solute-binding protein [Eubacterium sp.]|nr:extracellular solute-binding protein [Eubacterium sp.]MBR7073235.1 extracellular solute-binding protein [Eubacterium sp.]